MPTIPTGYSGTPLMKKLGIKAGMRVCVLHEPADYRDLLGPDSQQIIFQSTIDTATNLVHLFSVERAILISQITLLRRQLQSNVPVWVSWPKKASKVVTEITEDTIREVALPLGFVDVKVCAVSSVWSGLKLVVRRELRS